MTAHDSQIDPCPHCGSGANEVFAPAPRRRKRPKFPRETWDTTAGIVRLILATRQRFLDNREDPYSLEYAMRIKQAADWLLEDAIEAVHASGVYSDAYIAQVLGMTRQGVWQKRNRARQRREAAADARREVDR